MKSCATVLLVLCSACLMPPQSGGGGNYAGNNGGYPASSGGGGGGGGDPAFAPASSGGAPAATAPAGPVSVTIRSACSKTVKVFYGEKPKFGSGTYSSIDSNSVQSHSFRPGEMLWIVDESENGLGSATVSTGTRELEVGSSCTSISAR
jgi:hypothetical protein